MWHSWFDNIEFGINATLNVFPVDAIYCAFLLALFIYCASSPFARSLPYADSFAFIVIPSVLWYDSPDCRHFPEVSVRLIQPRIYTTNCSTVCLFSSRSLCLVTGFPEPFVSLMV